LLISRLGSQSVTRSASSRSGFALAVPVIVLLTGALVYLLDRPAASVPFFAQVSLADRFPIGLGMLGLSLPTFTHTFAFSALTATLMGERQKATAVACLSWLVIECAFEFGQSAIVSSRLASLISTRFASLPVLSQTRDYFIYGTFDSWDLLSIGIGAISAYVFIEWVRRGPEGPTTADKPQESSGS